jgi:hypothetical protein
MARRPIVPQKISVRARGRKCAGEQARRTGEREVVTGRARMHYSRAPDLTGLSAFFWTGNSPLGHLAGRGTERCYGRAARKSSPASSISPLGRSRRSSSSASTQSNPQYGEKTSRRQSPFSSSCGGSRPQEQFRSRGEPQWDSITTLFVSKPKRASTRMAWTAAVCEFRDFDRWFRRDSALEGTGFEPSVPLLRNGSVRKSDAGSHEASYRR